MSIKFIDKLIYNTTKKPIEYKRVSNPPKTTLDKLLDPQNARQQQFNNWCKRKEVYCGSYLPENPDTLLKKGWKETTSPKNKTNKIREFQRNSTKQIVRYDDKKIVKGKLEDEHYHWLREKSIEEGRFLKKNNDKMYYNSFEIGRAHV